MHCHGLTTSACVQARIFVTSRSPSQQGFAKTLHDSSKAPQWRIAFDTTGKWENQLMGWTSTADTLENVARASLFFYTKEEAADFCTKHGWEYSIDLPNERKAARTKRFNAYSESREGGCFLHANGQPPGGVVPATGRGHALMQSFMAHNLCMHACKIRPKCYIAAASLRKNVCTDPFSHPMRLITCRRQFQVCLGTGHRI